MKELYLYYDYWKNKNLNNIYHKGVHFKSNPRTFEYLTSKLKDKITNSDVVILTDMADLEKIDFDAYEKIILLYPDSTGLGWYAIERIILKNVNEMKNIYIINGRGRKIVFNKLNLMSLRIKRCLERSLLGEIIFTVFFIVSTPFLLIKDLINGKN